MEVKEFFKQAKVGDMVDLSKDLKAHCTYGTDTYIEAMPKPGTKGLKIKQLCENVSKFRVENCLWNFTPEMVTCVYPVSSEEKKEKNKGYGLGDTVTFRSDLKDGKLNEGTKLTFFAEGPAKAGGVATIVEVSVQSKLNRPEDSGVFKVKGSPYYYDFGMLAKEGAVKLDDTAMPDKERIIQTVIDRINDKEKVFEFLDQKLVVGCVIKIRENAHKTAKYWGCNYLPDRMLESGRTSKITDVHPTITCPKTHGNRFCLDKEKAGCVYSVPMFDEVYCITRNPSIYKEFLETFDVDKVTETESSEEKRVTISAELIRESIKKLQELEKAFEKMLQ